MKYVIEHLEPRLYKWCIIEYRHISRIVDRDNLIFTNLNPRQAAVLGEYGRCYTKSVSDLDFKGVCVLDPAAEVVLSQSEIKKFNYLVFGGILGDYPAKQRTKNELVVKNADRRNIGKEQFPTDNAVAVCRNIVSGTQLEHMKFADDIELDIKEGESVKLPFRYLLVNGRPLISEELVEHLKKTRSF